MTQRDLKNKEDYKELAMTIFDLVAVVADELGEAAESHEGSKFWVFCLEFNEYVIVSFRNTVIFSTFVPF
jgi:hypothetical protein